LPGAPAASFYSQRMLRARFPRSATPELVLLRDEASCRCSAQLQERHMPSGGRFSLRCSFWCSSARCGSPRSWTGWPLASCRSVSQPAEGCGRLIALRWPKVDRAPMAQGIVPIDGRGLLADWRRVLMVDVRSDAARSDGSSSFGRCMGNSGRVLVLRGAMGNEGGPDGRYVRAAAIAPREAEGLALRAPRDRQDPGRTRVFSSARPEDPARHGVSGVGGEGTAGECPGGEGQLPHHGEAFGRGRGLEEIFGGLLTEKASPDRP